MFGRLRRSDCSLPGIGRRRRGRGFSYFWEDDGAVVEDPETLRRIKALVIPPAWRDVWICPYRNGHVQATGMDAAGRRQYLYHDTWCSRRDAAKYDHVIEMARALPDVREAVRADLRTRGLNHDRVLAAAIRLLDLGFFRAGSEQYARDNGSFGLATVLRDQVTVERGGVVAFTYTSKGGRERYQAVADPEVVAVVRSLKRRRDDGPELLAYWQSRTWHDVRSDDVNERLGQVFGMPVTAKDFRIWHATVLAAVGFAVSVNVETPTQRKRATARVMREVAEYLGNTPAVARSSYVDPRLVDRFLDGETIVTALPELGDGTPRGHLATEGPVEDAVVELLSDADDS